ncbi:MAG: 50S ribosomal protein L6 [Gammaproteobacteria bacterium]
MSRVGKKPIPVPKGVEVQINGQAIAVKGPKGALDCILNHRVQVVQADGELQISPRDETQDGNAQSGTARALLANMVTGVSNGFERRLDINGVGYRAQAKGQVVSLSLGFSHPVEFAVPAGITVETPTQTEIVIKGIDKQKVGQVAANIRAYRPPEPYKGKGVRYRDEMIRR